jgi:POT family proton-dependent oligopeptide transporter
MTLARDESPSEVDKSTCISTDATIEGIPVAGLKNEVDVTEHQIQDRRELPRRADRLTLPIVVVIAVGGLERAAYYAVTVPWRTQRSR